MIAHAGSMEPSSRRLHREEGSMWEPLEGALEDPHQLGPSLFILYQRPLIRGGDNVCIGWMRELEKQKEVLHSFPADETGDAASSQSVCPFIIRGRDHFIRGGRITNEGLGDNWIRDENSENLTAAAAGGRSGRGSCRWGRDPPASADDQRHPDASFNVNILPTTGGMSR